MSDFTPEVRNQALWSGDARRFVEGKGGEVYAEKIGAKPLDDLSNVEVVQMGLVMQEPVMREYARRNQIAFKDADYALYHPKEKWMDSGLTSRAALFHLVRTPIAHQPSPLSRSPCNAAKTNQNRQIAS